MGPFRRSAGLRAAGLLICEFGIEGILECRFLNPYVADSKEDVDSRKFLARKRLTFRLGSAIVGIAPENALGPAD